MTILIDSSEPSSTTIPIKLNQLGIKTKIQSLKIGDYWIGNESKTVIIERKAINDFLASVCSVDNRYYTQLYNMMINSNKNITPVVYIVGTLPTVIPMTRGKGGRLVPINVKETIKITKIVSLFSFSIPVLQVANDEEFIDELIQYHNKSGNSSPSLKPIDVRRKVKSIEEIRISIYGQVPGIGKKAANYLGKEYTIPQMSTMSLEKLREIKIGNRKLGKRANKLYEVFNT